MYYIVGELRLHKDKRSEQNVILTQMLGNVKKNSREIRHW
jgi:hypothetical protein